MSYVDGFVLPVPTKSLAAFMDPKSLPFDGKRMFWRGFKSLVKA